MKRISFLIIKIFSDKLALVHAVSNGLIRETEKLLAKGLSPRIKSGRWELIIHAAAGGHAEVIKLLLKYGADINASGRNGRTALSQSVFFGHKSCVEYLLKNGADKNITVGLNPFGDENSIERVTIKQIAEEKKDSEIISLL